MLFQNQSYTWEAGYTPDGIRLECGKLKMLHEDRSLISKCSETQLYKLLDKIVFLRQNESDVIAAHFLCLIFFGPKFC